MRCCQSILIALFLSLAAAVHAGSGDSGPRLANPEVLDALRAIDTPGLPKNLTPGERVHLRLPDFTRMPRLPPVAEQLYTAAEFERNEAILMRWGNFNSVLTEMIVPITTGDSLASILLVVSGSAQQASAASTLATAGANLDRVDFVIAPSNSVWIRDYGPRFSSADNDRIIIDHEYNRPRPQDNQIPAAIATYLNEDLYAMPIAHGGGNFHLFANGEAYMTDLVVEENPGYTPQDVIDLYASYQRVDLTLLPPLPASFDSTQHLDMWFLPVDDRTVIIGDYTDAPPGVNPALDTNAVIDVTEFTATLMENRGYTVLRTPGWRSQGFGSAHHTYTNAVIVNDIVLICRFNGFAPQNTQARTVFEQAFPGKVIVPVDCSAIISSAGALHCIVKHQPGSSFRLEVDQSAATACAPDAGSEELTIEVSVQGINDFDDAVTFVAFGEPTGVASQFDPPSVTMSGEATWTLTVDASAGPGTSEISLFGTDRIGPGLPVGLSLTLQTALPGPGLVKPPDLAEELALQPVLEWHELPGAAGYRVQVALDPDFNTIVVNQWVSENRLSIEADLDSGELHYWRVLTGNDCGDGPWSELRQFRTRFLPLAELTPVEFAFDLSPDSTDSALLTIVNIGNGELAWAIEALSCSGGQSAAWLDTDVTSGSALIHQSSTVEISIDAAGLAPGLYEAGLCVTTNESGAEPISVPVRLEVSDPLPGQFQLEPGALEFGEVATGSSAWRDLSLSNVAEAGSADLMVSQIQIVSGQTVFSLDQPGSECAEFLEAQAACTIRVQFSPHSPMAHSGVLRVIVDGQVSNIALSGRGVEPEPGIFHDRFESVFNN